MSDTINDLLYASSPTQTTWKQAWLSSAFRREAIITAGIGLLLLFFIPGFLNFIQTVPGDSLNDVVLSHLPVHNFSVYTFLILYSSLLLALSNLVPYPLLLLRGLQAYLLLTVLRGCSLYLFPLEPDKDIIPLVDPLIDHFFYQRTVITKDLFFSGHVSTMTLLYFLVPSSFLKRILLTATVSVAVFILIQHVHYTVDVLVAPVVAYTAYRIIFLKKHTAKHTR